MKPSIKLTVTGRQSQEYGLHVELTNTSLAPLTLYRHSLPWVGPYSMILVAVKTDAQGTVLESESIIDDPGADTVTVQPGETLSGIIPLGSRFPGFSRSVNERDIIVFWTYQLRPIDRSPLERAGGYVLFPKS